MRAHTGERPYEYVMFYLTLNGFAYTTWDTFQDTFLHLHKTVEGLYFNEEV